MVLTRGDSRSAVMVLQQTLNCWQRCLMNSFCWSRVDALQPDRLDRSVVPHVHPDNDAGRVRRSMD